MNCPSAICKWDQHGNSRQAELFHHFGHPEQVESRFVARVQDAEQPVHLAVVQAAVEFFQEQGETDRHPVRVEP